MTYQETLAYIHNINWCFCKPGLERTRELCEKLGNPQKELRYIHVAGTNGKGSTCAMLESILRAAGFKTGLYTSPYVRRFNERMQVMGEPITDEELVEITELVRPIADSMEEKPTEFELITAIAFEYFRRQKVDVVILEVGLGGRLDSTNVIENPLLSIITGIAFDHISLLGNTLQAIAAEKAGIIKPGCPVLFGGKPEGSACRTVGAVAQMRKAPFHRVDRSTCKIKEYALAGTRFDYGVYDDLELSLLGTYQPFNAATVLTAMELLREQGFVIPEKAVRQGLKSVRWPARFELICNDPVVIFDGGHNPQGVEAAVKSIGRYFPEEKVNLISGVMADKAYDEMINLIKPVAEQVFTVTPNNPRALASKDYAAYFEAHKVKASAYDTVEDGIRAAIKDSRESVRPLICLGSLYLSEEFYDKLQAISAEEK
jgi:dihydrofolate synthase/folylpolyglutamate synthase